MLSFFTNITQIFIIFVNIILFFINYEKQAHFHSTTLGMAAIF